MMRTAPWTPPPNIAETMVATTTTAMTCSVGFSNQMHALPKFGARM